MALAVNILKTLETSSSIGMFARDTGGCLFSKLALSRSKDETKEISFAEISESAVFYFAAPALAKGTSKLFSKIQNQKLSKFAQITSVFGLILPLIYSIAPLRNIMTYSNNGKNKFTNVVGLEEDEKDKQNAEDNYKEDASKKAKNLIKKLSAISAATLTAGLGAATIAKNKEVYKKIEPALDKVIKYFDFTKEGDLTLKHYGALIYPVSILSYFNSSRDKYEKQENARRFAITVPLMFFGEKLIQNPIYKFFDKKFQTNIFNNGKIKTYNDILKLPLDERNKLLKSKNKAYASVFFINTIAIAAAVSLLNRIETKRKFKQDKEGANG